MIKISIHNCNTINFYNFYLFFQIARQKELSKVSIKKEDVELIINELELTKSKAERALREHQGDLYKTLVTLTN